MKLGTDPWIPGEIRCFDGTYILFRLAKNPNVYIIVYVTLAVRKLE